MQLFAERQSIEEALAEYVQAAFSPAEREIQRIRAQIEQSKPRSRRRVILESELVKARTRQLGIEVVK